MDSVTSSDNKPKSFYKTSTYTKKFSHYPLDTGRKLNVHKSFSRRPGRLLNVFCVFNLRRVYGVGSQNIML